MHIGMVGLGRMGGNMAERLRHGGHTVTGYDPHSSASDVPSLEALTEQLPVPKVVWVMVPAGDPTSETIERLGVLLASSAGSVVVDGGNSKYTDDQAHAALLAEKGVRFVDCGVSGGIWGLTEGYALMVGGAKEDVATLQPIFDTLKPAGDAGFVHAGQVGAGHFVKMVHNGIEYGMMQAYAEGYELMSATPLVDDVEGTMASWRQGTVIRSWLLDLAVRALEEDPGLAKIRGVAADSGEGRWTLEAAIEARVPMPVIASSLFARFTSQQEDSPAIKMVAALRNQFGGHAVTGSDGAASSPLQHPQG